MEDFVPLDPRDEVLVRRESRLLRLFPGSVERPLADAERWSLVAAAVDEVLVDKMGFGVSDYVDVGLRYLNHAIAMMSPAWPEDDVEYSSPPVLTTAELDAGGALVASGGPETAADEREFKALQWATTQAESLPYSPADPQSVFGRYLRVTLPMLDDSAVSSFWLPPAFLPDAMGHGVVVLASQAAREPGVARRFAELSARRTRRALWRFTDVILGSPDRSLEPTVSPGDVVQWVATLGAGRAVLVQSVARLDLNALPFNGPPAAVRVAESAQSKQSDSIVVPLPSGAMEIDANTEVVPLILCSGAGHIVAPQIRGATGMSLDDLIWAATTADSDSDLFTFCRELSRPDRPDMFGWEAINYWEFWRSNRKSFFSGSNGPTYIMIAAHHGDAEWKRGADLAALEKALFALGLPPVQDFDLVETHESGPSEAYAWDEQHGSSATGEASRPEENGKPELISESEDDSPLHRRPGLSGWHVMLSTVPVAVQSASASWLNDDVRLLHDFGAGLAFGFEQIRDTWSLIHKTSAVRGYLLQIQVAGPSATSPLGGYVHAPDRQDDHTKPVSVTNVVAVDGPLGLIVRAIVRVDTDAFVKIASASIKAVQQALAEVAGTVLARSGQHDAESVAEITAAWERTRPTLAVKAVRAHTVRTDLADPWKIDPALVADVNREIAEAIRMAGVAPGEYVGDVAKTLDRDVLAPAALGILTRRLAALNVEDVVLFGMEQLERCIASKEQQTRDLEQSATTMTLAWDPVARIETVEREHLVLRRCAEVVVEAALRDRPNGVRPIDRLAWMELLAASHGYLEATSRSESVHHQVRPTSLEISDSYEIRIAADRTASTPATSVGSGQVYNLDIERMRRARVALSLSTEGVPATDSLGSLVTPEGVDVSNDVLQTEHEGIFSQGLDAAMLHAYGASATDLCTVLVALGMWPLNPTDRDAAVTSEGSLLDYLVENMTSADEPDGPSRLLAALSLLTSSPVGLTDADWRPWHARRRQRRLLVQPVVAICDEFVVVAPHFCVASMGVYIGYLQQGLLPWSQPDPPPPVAQALDVVRDRRNRALEEDVAQLLRATGYLVETRIRESDPQRLGVPCLSTEIDVVAAHPDSLVIWLLEVKDPAEVYVVPEIRRHLDRFYIGGERKPAYVAQLQRKFDDLASYSNQVAAALGLAPAPAGTSYQVRPVFVTRLPVPAAYVGGPFAFAALGELLDFLTSNAVSRSQK